MKRFKNIGKSVDLGMDEPADRIHSEALRINLEHLGMEARSILRSIRTEHGKLAQSPQLARSDLHYFRARHNYYRLSLMRLEPLERQILEPVLAKFRDKIHESERGGSESRELEKREAQPTPFLAPVELEAKEPAVKESSIPELREPSKTSVSESVLKSILMELELVEIALTAEASNERNRVIQSGIHRIKNHLLNVSENFE